jgi:hypothetical protein
MENEENEDGENVSSEMERDTPSVDGGFACCEANSRQRRRGSSLPAIVWLQY